MTPLKMAVVGTGALGRHHARILSKLDAVDLVAVADTRPEIGQAVAQQCGTRWVTDYRELLGAVQAVTIAVPTTAHLAVSADFLAQGIPVLVEKPLAGCLDDAERIVQLADRHNALLQVGHVERFNPATSAAWKLCGPPKYIRAERVSPFAFRSMDIGVVHDLMIHDLDLILELVRAAVTRVEAFGVSILGGHEDAVQARITFANGCIADLTANRVCPEARRSMQIWSHRGAVCVNFMSREVVAYTPSETLLYGTTLLERAVQPKTDVEQLKGEVFGTYLKVEKPPVAECDALTAELQSFVHSVLTGYPPVVDGPQLANGRQALQAMTLADQVLDAVAAHQWDGQLDGAIGPRPRLDQLQKRAG